MILATISMKAGDAMNSLSEIVQKLLPEIMHKYDRQEEMKFDRETVQMVREKAAPQSERAAAVRSWLYGYSVLRGIKAENVTSIVLSILDYADGSRPASLDLNPECILREFEELHRRLKPSMQGRNPESLTSKALWLCYPEEIPILDEYAERALQIICRIYGIAVQKRKDDRYGTFIHAWFSVYGECKEALDATRTEHYDFRIRFLDWFLWYLGRPEFD